MGERNMIVRMIQIVHIDMRKDRWKGDIALHSFGAPDFQLTSNGTVGHWK